MTGETEGQLLGVARVDLLVNTDQWEAAIQQGETRLSRMTQSAQDEYAKLDKTEKRRVDTLLKQIDALGKTREEQLLTNAAYNGLTKYPALFDELRSRTVAAAAATKQAANNAKELGDALKGATFSDAQLYRANQALNEFKTRADSARLAQEALGAADAADESRIRDVVRASLERVDAESRLIAAQQRSIEMTDAQRAAVERIKASQTSQAAVNERAQRLLDTEARSRQQAAVAAKGEGDALQRLLGQIDPTIAAYERLDRIEAQLRAHRKSGAISQEDYDAYAAKIDKARAAVGGADQALNHFALTSGVARREIGTLIGELARGDIGNFQSSLITLASNTGLLSSLLSPAAIGAAALASGLAVVATAAASAYEEEQRLNQAIATSGNFAGITAGGFEQLASGISTSNGHLSDARDILDGLVSSGRVGAAALESVGQAGYDIAVLTKKGAEEATQAALQMFDGTTASLLKANEQYHFLNEATYERVKALEEEGKQQEAARVAAEAFHDVVGPRIQTMTDQVYGLARAWEEAKRGTADWYETFKNGASLILGTASLDSQIAALQGRREAAQKGQLNALGRTIGSVINPDFLGVLPGGGDFARASRETFSADDQKQLDDLLAKREKIVAQAEEDSRNAANRSASIAADQRIDRMADGIDKAHQLQTAIRSLNADFDTLWSKSDGNNKRLAGVQRIVNEDGSVSFAGGQYDKLRADLEKKYTDNSAAKLGNADAAAQLSAFKASLSQYTDAYANAQRELDAQRKAGSISEADYYERSRAEVWKTEQAQVDAIQAEIAVLQARKVAGADAAKNQAQIADLSAQLHKAEADALSRVNVLTEQEAGEKAKATAAINAYIQALGQQTAARQAEIDLQVAAVGMGDKEFAQLQRLNKIRQDAADQQVKLTKQLNTVGSGGIDQETYDRKTAELKKATDDRVAAELDGQARIDAAQADWRNGARRATDEINDHARDTAGQFGSFVQDTYGSLSDFIYNATTTGKANIKDLASSILKEAERIASNKAAAALITYGISLFTGGGGGATGAGDALNGGGNYTGYGSLSTSWPGMAANAMGGVYDSPSLSKYSGQVVDRPTIFAFARGAGLMGEAGPEAIMPLTRTADGKLGVRTAGGQGGVVIDVDVTVNADGSGQTTAQGDYQTFGKQLGENMRAIAQQELQRAMAPGGVLWRRG